MNRSRVRLTIEALDDLKRRRALLIEKDPAVAARAVDAIETSFELLACSPLFLPQGLAGRLPNSCGRSWEVGQGW